VGYTVGDLVAEFLIAAGLTTAYGILSVHNWPVNEPAIAGVVLFALTRCHLE
jgi:hypothetical protein